jgi:hypothetical protein
MTKAKAKAKMRDWTGAAIETKWRDEWIESHLRCPKLPPGEYHITMSGDSMVLTLGTEDGVEIYDMVIRRVGSD